MPSAARPPFLGIYMTPLSEVIIPGEKTQPTGIKIKILSGSPAEKAGLIDGDIIIGVNDLNFTITSDKILIYFKDEIKKKKPGDLLKLKIYRSESEVNVSLNGIKENKSENTRRKNLKNYLDNRLPGDNITFKFLEAKNIINVSVKLNHWPEIYLQSDENTPSNKKLYPDIHAKTDSLSEFIPWLFNSTQKTKYKDLLKRLAEDENWHDKFRFPMSRFSHRAPAKIKVIVRKSTKTLKSFSPMSLQFKNELLYLFLKNTRRPATGQIINSLKKLSTGLSIKQHVQQISQYMQITAELRNKAFLDFSKDELTFFHKNIPVLLNSLVQSINLNNSKNWVAIKKLLKLSRKIDFSALQKMMQIGFLFVDKKYLDGLKKDFKKNNNFYLKKSIEGAEGNIIAYESTGTGEIIIGGPDVNRYRKSFAVIIDTGGNDLYAASVAANTSLKQSFSLVIDLSGHDSYQSTELGVATAITGIATLIDLAGNDNYTSTRFLAGCGFAGAGIFLDSKGNDTYHVNEYGNGVGLWGIGVSIDLAGFDTYQAGLFSQGVGLPAGIGLSIDKKGNDTYIANGTHKSSYNIDGIYKGYSQGLGMGFRGFSSGGLGILIDSSGDDVFRAGNFSQAAGYYFGWGILINSGNGNDQYYGSRYSQSAAAHSALATFIDEGGDDIYSGLMGVSNSAAWDLSATLFIDYAGNDTYSPGGGFALAAADQNGHAVFLDLGGSDVYMSKPAFTGENIYHGGSSFALFIDAGSKKNVYKGRKRTNYIRQNDNNEIFIDAVSEFPEDNFQKYLKSLTKDK